MIVVLDANVLVSGLISPKGPPGQILDAWMAGFFELVVSPQLLQELRRVLEYPRISEHINLDVQTRLLNLLTNSAMVLMGKLTVDVLTSDPSDNIYLACALEGKTDYLVTGNLKHFEEALNRYPHVKILSPRAFLDILLED